MVPIKSENVFFYDILQIPIADMLDPKQSVQSNLKKCLFCCAVVAIGQPPRHSKVNLIL